MLTLTEYQAMARTTAIYQHPIIYPALGLASEAGELCGKIKKWLRDDGAVMTPERRQAIVAEMGDTLYYLAALASDLDVDLESVARTNLDKLASRAQRSQLQGDGDNR